MRRLLVFAIAVVFVESIFFAALAPLLPELTDDLGLSTFGAGVLVAAYAFGALLGAIPSGLAVSRLGVRPTVLWGLGLLAVTCVAFGFVDSYALLVGARIGQGVAASFLWTGALAWLVDAAPPDRRGEYLGYTTSGAIAGSLVGPLLGGAASHFGRGATFAGVAVLCAPARGLGAPDPRARGGAAPAHRHAVLDPPLTARPRRDVADRAAVALARARLRPRPAPARRRRFRSAGSHGRIPARRRLRGGGRARGRHLVGSPRPPRTDPLPLLRGGRGSPRRLAVGRERLGPRRVHRASGSRRRLVLGTGDGDAQRQLGGDRARRTDSASR